MFGNLKPLDWQQLGLTAGLSMLGNNNGSKSFGQLVGNAGLDALTSLQARKQYEAAMARQQAQDDMERQKHELAMKQGQIQMDEATKKAELMKRWQTGDQSAYQYLFPEQWAADQRQARAHQNDLALEDEKRKAREAEAQKGMKILEALGILPGTLPVTATPAPASTSPTASSPVATTVDGHPTASPAPKRNIMDLTPEEQVALAASGKTGKTIVETVNKAKEHSPSKHWDKASSEMFAKVYSGARDAAAKGLDTVDNVKTLLGALDSGLYTGYGGEFAQKARNFAASLGFGDFKDSAAAGEVFESIVKGMALEKRDPATGAGMPGALSDSDREYLKSMVPSLSKTTEGNKILLKMIGRMAERRVEYYQMMNDYVVKHGQLDAGFDKQMAGYKWKDMFSDLPQNTQKPPVTTKPGNRSLPSIWGGK